MNESNNSQIGSEMEDQLSYGAMHTHSVLSTFAERINTMESFLYGLADALIESGHADPELLKAHTARVAQEIKESGEKLASGTALRIENPQKIEEPQIDCASRLHICKAACCKLHFALSADEVESGSIKWEIGRPYFIRHDKEGYCSHLRREGKGCSCDVYDRRPKVCRVYSCKNDARIWKDFDKMELNEAWIEANLGGQKPRFLRTAMDYPAQEKGKEG